MITKASSRSPLILGEESGERCAKMSFATLKKKDLANAPLTTSFAIGLFHDNDIGAHRYRLLTVRNAVKFPCRKKIYPYCCLTRTSIIYLRESHRLPACRNF